MRQNTVLCISQRAFSRNIKKVNTVHPEVLSTRTDFPPYSIPSYESLILSSSYIQGGEGRAHKHIQVFLALFIFSFNRNKY